MACPALAWLMYTPRLCPFSSACHCVWVFWETRLIFVISQEVVVFRNWWESLLSRVGFAIMTDCIFCFGVLVSACLRERPEPLKEEGT